jgi:hypothetical protein
MRRELEEELKNECFLAQMKINRLNDMEDFFHNEDWCYENDENGNMIFFIYNHCCPVNKKIRKGKIRRNCP